MRIVFGVTCVAFEVVSISKGRNLRCKVDLVVLITVLVSPLDPVKIDLLDQLAHRLLGQDRITALRLHKPAEVTLATHVVLLSRTGDNTSWQDWQSCDSSNGNECGEIVLGRWKLPLFVVNSG